MSQPTEQSSDKLSSPPDIAAPSFPIRWPWLWVGVLVVYGLGLALPHISTMPLMSHEVLVVDRTEGLMTEGKWVVPYTEGRPDFRKPPLPFWIVGALSYLTGGVNELTVRLPSVAATLGVMMLLVFYVRRVVGWRPALVTGWVFLTSAAALSWGRRAEVDMQLTFWTSLAVLAYASGLSESIRRRQVAWFLVMWIATGTAVLVKGPLPLGVLAVTVVLTAVFRPQARRVGKMLPVVGPLITLAIIALWAVPVIIKYPHALSIWEMQSLGRFAGKMGHEKPIYYYLMRAPLLWLPWLFPVAVGIYLAVRGRLLPKLQWVVLLAWGLGSVALLSASTGKRIYYALPAAPPILILGGLGLHHLLFRVRHSLTGKAAGVLWLHMALAPVALAATVVGAVYLPRYKVALVVIGCLSAMLLVVVFQLYRSGRRSACFLTAAAGFLVIYTVAIGSVGNPLAIERNAGAALGRHLATMKSAEVCLFRTGVGAVGSVRRMMVEFYAGRKLPLIDDLDAMRAWRDTHPDGLVFITRKSDLEKLQELGPWVTVFPDRSAASRWYRDIAMLRAASQEKQPPTDNHPAASEGRNDGP